MLIQGQALIARAKQTKAAEQAATAAAAKAAKEAEKLAAKKLKEEETQQQLHLRQQRKLPLHPSKSKQMRREPARNPLGSQMQKDSRPFLR